MSVMPKKHGDRWKKSLVPVYGPPVISARKRLSGHGILRRLPKDFNWQLYEVLRQDLSSPSDPDHGAIRGAVRNRDFEALASAVARPRSMQDAAPWDFARRYLLGEYLRKYDDGTDKTAAALAKFCETEERCLETNARLLDPQIANKAFVKQCQLICRRILGQTPTILAGRHGPGATATQSRKDLDFFVKFSDLPYACSDSARDLFVSSLIQSPRWSFSVYQFCECRLPGIPWHAYSSWQDSYSDLRGLLDTGPFRETFLSPVNYNRVAFVPKTWKTFRTIAMEPVANMFLQLGLDSVVRRRLLKEGIDLADQTRNQSFANRALKNNYATLDLEAASDSISLELVRLFLPPGWFKLFDSLRVPFWRCTRGNQLLGSGLYQKFSSMGNGYTFSLQTLIYRVIYEALLSSKGLSALATDAAFYGDDIVIPRQFAAEYISLLEFFGFIVNREKSFVDGFFFESCGSARFKGFEVTPPRMYEAVTTVDELLVLRNGLFMWYRSWGEELPQSIDLFFRKYLGAFEALSGPPVKDNLARYVFREHFLSSNIGDITHVWGLESTYPSYDRVIKGCEESVAFVVALHEGEERPYQGFDPWKKALSQTSKLKRLREMRNWYLKWIPISAHP